MNGLETEEPQVDECQLDVDEDGVRCTLHVSGVLDAVNVPAIWPTIDRLLGVDMDQLDVDMSRLELMDSSGAAVIDIGHDPIDKYKLVVLSSAYLIDDATAAAVRRYVANGGTLIMTGYSAKVDATGKWFGTPLPGGLTDVFGLRTNEFYRSWNPLIVSFQGKQLTGSDNYYEVLEPSTAKTLAIFENTPAKSPAITINKFGKGRAIYLATAAQAQQND